MNLTGWCLYLPEHCTTDQRLVCLQPKLVPTNDRVSDLGLASGAARFWRRIDKIVRMPIHWTALTIQLGTTGAVFYGTQKLFKEIEDKLHPDTKLAISLWLLDAEVKLTTFGGWPETCSRMFTQIFGKRHFSWRCFFRSAAVSFVVFWVVFVLCVVGQLPLRDFPGSLLGIVAINFPFSVLPDYFSLLITRLVLMLAVKVTRSTGLLFALLVIDLYLSAVVLAAAFGFGVRFLILSGGSPGSNLLDNIAFNLPIVFGHWAWLKSLTEAFNPSLAANLVSPRALRLTGPYVASALCTSAWLWAYVLAGLSLRTIRRASFGLKWVNKTLDIECKPLQAIGLIVGSAVSVLWLIGVILFVLF